MSSAELITASQMASLTAGFVPDVALKNRGLVRKRVELRVPRATGCHISIFS